MAVAAARMGEEVGWGRMEGVAWGSPQNTACRFSRRMVYKKVYKPLGLQKHKKQKPRKLLSCKALQCGKQDLNLHDLLRSLGPQPLARLPIPPFPQIGFQSPTL